MNENTNLTFYQKIRDVILNRVKGYYENDKERIRRKARDKYINLSEEEKNKKREYGKKIDISICLKKRKKRLKEYQKNYCEAKKISKLQ